MIKAVFILLTIIMAALAYTGISIAATRYYTQPEKLNRFKRTTLLLVVSWLAYATLISLSGFLQSAALPPRLPLMLILPLFSFMAWFVSRQRFRGLIAAIPAAWLVYAQSFRIVVELLLHALYRQGMLPRAATYEGYNYEILIGITALAVGYAGYSRRGLPKAVLLGWNITGLATLAIVVFIFLSHAYFSGIYTNPGPLSVKDFGTFPFTLLAGFLMPMAVFMHVLSIVKLVRGQK